MSSKLKEALQGPPKKYEVGALAIYNFNDRRYVVARSLEEAIALFRDYQEKEVEDSWRGDHIKTVELVAPLEYVISKKGTVEGIDKWGMKKLAYPINFRNEGFYVLMNITLNPEEVDAMAKLMNSTEGIVRQMFVRK